VWERAEDGVRFASDLFALDILESDARTIDSEATRDYLILGYVPAPRCIWRGPRKIMPGTYAQIRWREGSNVQVTESSFWSFNQIPPANISNGVDCDKIFSSKVRAAVRSRLVSDVPVGLLLSGGIDSSTVAAACAELPRDEAN